jgi:hypothetical protein
MESDQLVDKIDDLNKAIREKGFITKEHYKTFISRESLRNNVAQYNFEAIKAEIGEGKPLLSLRAYLNRDVETIKSREETLRNRLSAMLGIAIALLGLFQFSLLRISTIVINDLDNTTFWSDKIPSYNGVFWTGMTIAILVLFTSILILIKMWPSEELIFKKNLLIILDSLVDDIQPLLSASLSSISRESRRSSGENPLEDRNRPSSEAHSGQSSGSVQEH